jgi:hypothetical protein
MSGGDAAAAAPRQTPWRLFGWSGRWGGVVRPRCSALASWAVPPHLAPQAPCQEAGVQLGAVVAHWREKRQAQAQARTAGQQAGHQDAFQCRLGLKILRRAQLQFGRQDARFKPYQPSPG